MLWTDSKKLHSDKFLLLSLQTEIGYARAWVRLALERKSLSEYLRVLVSDAGLLKNMYKRYAFLRYRALQFFFDHTVLQWE